MALRKILKLRQLSSDHKTVRIFKVPNLNFHAEDYVDLIDWKNMTEPPPMKIIHTQLIYEAIRNPDLVSSEIMDKFNRMPCHTQAVERCVKLVTEASAAVCGPERREGFIKNKLESRHIMPTFNTKKDFKL